MTYHLWITKDPSDPNDPNGKPNRSVWCLQVVSFRDSRDCVTHIAFSSDSNHLALAHADRSLCLYRWKVGVEKMFFFFFRGGWWGWVIALWSCWTHLFLLLSLQLCWSCCSCCNCTCVPSPEVSRVALILLYLLTILGGMLEAASQQSRGPSHCPKKNRSSIFGCAICHPFDINNPKNSAKHRHLGSFQHALSSPFTRQKTLCEPRKKKPGWLGYMGDYTTQLYRDYNKPL